MSRRPGGVAALIAVLALVAVACSAGEPGSSATPMSWSQITRQAQGQTVRWWMFGGDERVNGYVDEIVKPEAAKLGVTVQRVPMDDTGAVVQRLVAEVRAGESSQGSVDLVWINGENFAQGKQAELWLNDWARSLPNARFVNFDDPTIAQDFGTPVDGQESPWNRAAFVFAHDRARTPAPPRTFEQLLEYARAHPGRVTYPAPPDFTGSAFVRQTVQALGEDEAFELLEKLKPVQWRSGSTFPGSEAELNQLFGNGQVDFAMSYDPSFVLSGVLRGIFPETSRPFVLDSGTLQNTSYVAIPANSPHRAGALVLANLLLSPRLQAIKADPASLGAPTVLDTSLIPPQDKDAFRKTVDSPYTLTHFGGRLAELPALEVQELERRWDQEVLR